MLLALLILSVALALSGIAAYYSIIGLTAIFAAAVIPIIVMGGVLEVAKLTVTVWLHQNWQRARWIMKSYLVSAVAVLMFITSMGIFGFLSKSHIEQSAMGTEQVEQVKVIGPVSSEDRSGMVSFQISGMPAADVVEALNKKRIMTHARKRDHYSSTILEPLGVIDCVRASVCHYNSVKEIELFLEAVLDISS